MKQLFIPLLVFIVNTVSAQQFSTNYDPHPLWSPVFYTSPGTISRAATGEPNTGYWQNKADYEINASFNEASTSITGTVKITYRNNSPHALLFLWLQLDQNLFNKSSRGAAKLPVEGRSRYGDAASTFNGGYTIKSVRLSENNKPADYIINDTRMQIRLPKAMKPGGDVINIVIDYSYPIAEYQADRAGILKTKNGDVYAVAQWYPRMCVFDDVEGWNTLPYLGAGEFYLEYGDFDFTITTPGNYLVVASGELQNPLEVLSAKDRERLAQAKQSDKTIMIRNEQEMKTNMVAAASP